MKLIYKNMKIFQDHKDMACFWQHTLTTHVLVKITFTPRLARCFSLSSWLAGCGSNKAKKTGNNRKPKQPHL